MPKAKPAKIAQSKAMQGDVHPMVQLILNSHLKEYTFGPVRDYLRLYSAECYRLDSKSMRNKAKFVLREIDKLRDGQSSLVEQTQQPTSGDLLENPVNEQYEQPAVNQQPEPASSYDADFLRQLDEKPFLALKQVNWIKVDVTPMHWMHPIPYLFHKVPSRLYPTVLGHTTDDVHPGEPPHGPLYDSPPLPFDHHSVVAYDSRTVQAVSSETFERVVDVSRKIYAMNSSHRDVSKKRVIKSQTALNHARMCKDKSVALIARTLLETGFFVGVLPVRLQHNSTAPRVNCHYGFVLTLESGMSTILPLSIWFFGSQVSSTYYASNKMKTWMAKQWLRECPGLEILLDKFKDSPVLRCEDVRVIDFQSSRRNFWSPRRYATTWSISHCLSSVEGTVASPQTGAENLAADITGWHMFSDIKLLARKIATIARCVTFRGELPLKPFEVIEVNSFDFVDKCSQIKNAHSSLNDHISPAVNEGVSQPTEFEDPVTDLPDSSDEVQLKGKRGHPVDGKRTCVYHLECTLHPRAGSMYCLWHHRIVANQRPETFLTTIDKQTPDTSRQNSVAFTKPKSLAHWNTLRTLHKITKDYVVWLVDVEFYVVPGHMVVPWQVVVRDGSSGNIVLSSLIDYNSMSITEMVDKMRKHRTDKTTPNPCAWETSYSSVSKRYQGMHTTGLTLGSFGEALLDAGFCADTHRVLSWFCPSDMQVFTRAIDNDNEFLRRNDASYGQIYDSNGQPCLQPVNLGPFIKHCTDLQSCRLGFAHRSMFPGKYLEMHDPENDTLAMYEIYQRFLSETQDW